MDCYDKFYQQVKTAAEKFSQIDKKEPIRLISHLDADGISSAALFIKLLNNLNMKYSVSVVQQLNKDVLKELSLEKHKYFVFTDLGNGALSGMKELLNDREIFILDHHTPEETEIPGNITIVNPHYAGIDGGKEISSAGVVFYFAREMDEKMDEFAHVALIGAIGDAQEDEGFPKLTNDILEIAIKKGKIELKRGLRLFGAQTRPLHKALEYCTDPFIPGVSGSESGAIQFLYQIGIEPKNGSKWKKIVNLEKEEMQQLVTGIIMRRIGNSLEEHGSPDDVLGNIYILKDEQDESPTRDAKEFATLLNACGRMGRASLGIGACIGDKKSKDKAISSLNDYKKEIINALNWYHENRNSNGILENERYLIINAKDNVRSTIIGTLASILSKSNGLKKSFILAMAQSLDGTTKVSIRFNGKNENFDLRNIIQAISTDIEGCEAGGHQNAAGAIIPTSKENEFLESAKAYFEKIIIEEIV